ncbi:MAG: fibrobacter succinogenes major paralogous domain-containing protein, partial [bacterium]|nr:fibrobacter succinogenes major paralogous domain-containing protein [bacterium]
DGTRLTEGSGMYSNPAGSGSPWGKLYDWNTAMNGVSAATTIGAEIQGICPTGWHIPSDYNTDPSDDWQKLADFLGGYQVAGGKMKRTEIPLYWNVPNGGPFGDNSSGFSGVAAGFWQNGIFYNRGYYAFFLSSSEYTATAILNRVLFTDGTVFVFDPNKPKTIGYSVRCVKDLPLSVSSCRYACATNYTWNGSSCVANTQTYTCAAKPATGTNWNTVSSYSQTWNGSAWTPANSATAYNTTADTNSCRYTCAADYLWDSSACVLDNNCEASTSVCSTCWNNAAWVNGTVSCSTACTGPSGSQICAVDNGCAATTPIGQICWNSYEWVNGTYNTPPAVSGMTAPNWNYTQASANALRANLQFSFVDPDAGSYGSAYQVIIKKADDTPVLDTGVCTGYNTPSAKCKVDPTNCMENGSTGCINPGDCVCTYALDSAFLGYSQGYKWSVQVWDNHSAASTLTPYNSGSDTDNNDGSASTFTAYKHNMPIAGFTHSPDQPSKGEAAKFTNASQVYLSSAPNTAVNCTTGQCTYFWTATAGASINDTATTSPIITFNSNSNSTVTLKVTDNDGYYISVSDVININAQLPNWKEVKPE